MNWSIFVFGTAVFFTIHVLTVVPEAREPIAKKLGANAYKGLFAAISAIGFAAMLYGYGAVDAAEIWSPPQALRWVPPIAMPFSLFFLGCAYASKGGKRVVRHPMLWGILVWALAHLAANGDAASMTMFAAFAVYAVAAQILSDRRDRLRDPAGFATLGGATGPMPFVALASGRAKLYPHPLGWRPLIAAAIGFVLLLLAHETVIGVSPLPIE